MDGKEPNEMIKEINQKVEDEKNKSKKDEDQEYFDFILGLVAAF